MAHVGWLLLVLELDDKFDFNNDIVRTVSCVEILFGLFWADCSQICAGWVKRSSNNTFEWREEYSKLSREIDRFQKSKHSLRYTAM